MKKFWEIALFIFVFQWFTVHSQESPCFCDEYPELAEIIDCEPIIFENQSKIYWNFSCDSSWITFETARGDRQIIFSLEKDMLDYTTRLGYDGFNEFNNTILVSNSPISGCCYPPDYYLHDKNTGNLLAYLGRTVFITENRNIPLVISVTGSKYGVSHSKEDFNSLSIHHLEKNEIFTVPLPKGEISKAMRKNHSLFPEELFLEPSVENDAIKLVYFLNRKKQKIISIDLKKYI